METIIKDVQAKLKQVFAAFGQEIRGVRANRPSPALVEHVAVDIAGK